MPNVGTVGSIKGCIMKRVGSKFFSSGLNQMTKNRGGHGLHLSLD